VIVAKVGLGFQDAPASPDAIVAGAAVIVLIVVLFGVSLALATRYASAS